MAELATLLDAIRRAMWRHAAIPGERLRHDLDEHGNHHLTLTIERDRIHYSPPAAPRAKSLALGPSAGWRRPEEEEK